MFRFYRITPYVWLARFAISIHRMFRFYRRCYICNRRGTKISIHRMFRFYTVLYLQSTRYKNFNTSYVSVLRIGSNGKPILKIAFQYIVCFGSTKATGELRSGLTIFQYIVCFGSTKIKCRFCTATIVYDTA